MLDKDGHNPPVAKPYQYFRISGNKGYLRGTGSLFGLHTKLWLQVNVFPHHNVSSVLELYLNPVAAKRDIIDIKLIALYDLANSEADLFIGMY